MIEISNLRKFYGNKKVLDIPSLTIETSGITVIRGENGLGKTTLFSLISGIDPHYEGDIKKRGIDLKNMTFVQQNPYLFKRSVRDNLAYPLTIRKWDRNKINERVEHLMNTFGISHLADKKANSLSSGETQKVAMARAISFNPKLLLLDEPTSNLDKASTLLAENILSEYVKRESAGVIMITHDNAQAGRMAESTIDLECYIRR